LTALIALPGCAAEPSQPDPRGEISGRVVDAATGTPIEGAAVFATWRTELPPNPAAIAFGLVVGGHGGAERRVVRVKETFTDTDGRFVIPSWKESEQLRPGPITKAGPTIGFFKPGVRADIDQS
jgi:hypothetical protein